MRGVNRVIIVGTLGADPETRYTASGSAITSIRLATNEEWKDKQTGERQSRTDWHSVVFFGRLAEIAAEYLRKGKQVYIEGQLRTEEYTDKEGVKRWATKIYAREMQMLGGAGGDGQRSEGGQQRSSQRQQSAPPRDDVPPGGIHMSGDQFEDDEIPFE